MLDVSPFANRLAKNFKHQAKWARRQGLDAWRVYDKDVPQFPFAVDMYGERVHLQEYDTGWEMEDDAYRDWINAVVDSLCAVTGVAPAAVTLKNRRRQKGVSQYEKAGQSGDDFVINEFGQRFIVNLDAYLDTGLFLDHRNTRKRVREEAAGKRFLNLFAYTGSFTVYAACGGAISSETVDMSNTYQDWSRRNFELNGLDLGKHQLVRADVFQYLEEAVDAGKQFDLIVMDPPTFSNSKKMRDILDVQRDHVWLIDYAMALLAPGGTLYFSNNLRSFTLDERLADDYQIRDISAQSVPEDFRNRAIHQCWQIRRG
ncbi:23S rRNA (cytosine1962-C5)-methyltransferase [Chromobacterium alkanivorans]|uniref:class I SAM-dependent methyltransferase n=1 Tax=Chromobacterium alkanivorans TaxID=1071719 RepID=UPI001966EA1E|nr:class I SAM-dependent methyltransferase [Chromobacterium alkanivorans]MBN3005857.1 class I SAM-dependent methyltransferase [Chromobacterium alkanivorans]MCS3802354.1 23S rRNA (cytosine1962-C5)-methyltransferase [Chromobacterium alkanivorans]MCS3816681.1 23S rRNA (cytosine1962-C5)-methyltransferase [Chromobacterium alkanivorans]MCS3871720.1 23S rRNA (cytosine1962-C5)-methyltransferase [Chromobacterium alkanivorans]